jgi:SnoaL-like domain
MAKGDVMPNHSTAPLTMVVGLGFSTLVTLGAQHKPATAPPLTDQDRSQIQELVASYGRALGLCAAEEYARLFAEPDGYFASGPRGKVVGRERLLALVRSERHCNDNSERRARNIPPSIDIKASPLGATGWASLGPNGGHYEDVYEKTAQGWRFKSRAYISTTEEAAKLTAQDLIDIRRLAGNDSDHYEDVWSDAPEGKHFRSSGVVIAPSPEGATGRAYLKSGGRYDDVYVKTPQGWRFKSRAWVAEGAHGSRAGA